jgi:chorismate synthase
MSNTIGRFFRVTSWGESHGPAVGAVVDGCPAGLALDLEQIQYQLDRRKPGQSSITTPRKEEDKLQILSGVYEGRTTGAPIALKLANQDARPQDYDAFALAYRPSHADYTYDLKYGFRDPRGGGRSSARVTAGWVAAGAIAQQLLAIHGIAIVAYVSQVGPIILDKQHQSLDLEAVDATPVRCPDPDVAAQMMAYIEQVKAEHDSTGGVVTCVVRQMVAGLGAPIFGKLQAELAHAMLCLNAVHGFEYGSGFAGVAMRGSQHNDPFVVSNQGAVSTLTNNSGGIQGGISNGEDLYFRVAFKPTATILQAQQTVNQTKEAITLPAKGRHDPCVVPRAVAIVEALTAIVLADALLEARLSQVAIGGPNLV